MNRRSVKVRFIELNVLLLALFMASCVSSKNVTYFQNLSNTSESSVNLDVKFIEPVILADDILAISIITIDPSNAAVANQTTTLLGAGTSSNIGGQQINGFLVDKNGEVEIALIGKVKLSGLTTFQAREIIRQKALINFKDPNISVRFANFKVAVLGEVNKPASYTLPNEKVSVLDVLSLAGDLTLYGRRENVLVIREVDGRKQFGRLNLNNSTELFKSPFFYLRQNDVIYVEPTKAKVAALNGPVRNTIGIILSAVSVIVLAISRL